MTHFPLTRRALVAGAAGLALLAAAPAFAQEKSQDEPSKSAQALEEKGYALGDVVLGDADAPVTIIEYASMTCPHCASFHVHTFPEIKAKYIDTGKVKLIMREVYFDQFGLWSSMIARCGGEENYYKLISMYLDKQREWYADHVRAFNDTQNAQPIIAEMMKIGRLAGLSNDRMESCLSDQALLERVVTDFKTKSTEDGVRSTPTFFINGEEVVGAVSTETMSKAIDEQLGE